MWFEDFGDRLVFVVSNVAFPVVRGEDGPHNMGFVSHIVFGFTYSGGSVYFKGKGKPMLQPGYLQVINANR